MSFEHPPPGHCGAPAGYPGAGATEPPDDFLEPAILSFFCCRPSAAPAIIPAARVDAQWNLGDYAGAHERTGRATEFTLTAVIVGVVPWVLSAIAHATLIGTMMNSTPTTAY